MDMKHIAMTKRAPGMAAKFAQAECGLAAQIIRYIKTALDRQISAATATLDSPQPQHAPGPHMQASLESHRIAVQVRFHHCSGESDGRVQIELQGRPAECQFEAGGGGRITDQLVGYAKCKIIHRPGWRHADGPIADATRVILDAALYASIEDIHRARRIGKGREITRDLPTLGKGGVGQNLPQVIQVGLNAIQPGLGLQVREVSETTQKGKHTTTTAQLLRLDIGGWVVDTPGIRQFQLWDVLPEELEGFFPEFCPYVHLCGYPDCTHTHEERCAIKEAVEKRIIAASRYTSYLGLFSGVGDLTFD